MKQSRMGYFEVLGNDYCSIFKQDISEALFIKQLKPLLTKMIRKKWRKKKKKKKKINSVTPHLYN